MTHEEQFPNCPFCYANKKETAVIDDSNCHCGPCTAMNEPLTLEGDIRYLKAHIETKDRQLAEKDAALAEAKLRIDVYREAWADAERESARLREEDEKLKDFYSSFENSYAKMREAWQDAEKETIKLREENERRHSRIVEQNDWLVRLQQENKKLREENERLRNANAQVTDGFNLINKDRSKLVQEKITLEQHKARYQQEILALEGTIEDYAGAMQRLRDILRAAHEQVELFVKG